MRFKHILILALALPLSCTKQSGFGQDEALPGALDICYDDIVSSSTTLAVYWNGGPAIKAGAKSFTVQLVKKDRDFAGDNYNVTLSTTYAVAGLEYPGQAVFSGLKSGTKYHVRIRANYPEGRTSVWCYMQNEELGCTGVVKVGEGLVDEPVSRIAETGVLPVCATSSTLSFSFSSTKYLEYDTDAERTYLIELFKDAGCSDLVVSWIIDQSCGTGFSISNHPCFMFTGLEPDTEYWFRATDKTEDESPSPVIKARTTPFTPVTIPSSAAPGDVILAEDFSELVWGGSRLNNENAAGYSSGARGNAPSFEKAAGVNPLGGPYQFYLVGIGQDMQLFGSLSHAIPNSRLADWAYISEGNNTACMCAQAGHVKCGTGAGAASIVTPELSCLTGPARVRVSFKAQCMSETDNSAMCVEVIRNSSRDAGYGITVDGGNRIKAVQFRADSYTTATGYSFDIDSVKPGDRIAIGGDVSKKSSLAMRSFVDDIVITLVSYE